MQNDDLAPLLRSIQGLEAILGEEFEALRIQKIDKFEAAQTEKIGLLRHIESFKLPGVNGNPKDLQQSVNNSLWNQITTTLEKCKKAHSRNELLISKQLDTIRGALSALQNQDPSSTLELYTKLGQKRATRRSILSGDA